MNRLRSPNSVPFAARDLAPGTGTPQYATDGVPGTVPATYWPAYAFNMMMDELMSITLAAGIAADDTVWSQVWQALLRCHTFPDTGTTNHLVAGPPGGVPFNSSSLGLGTTVRVHVANTSTGGVDFNWASVGVLPVQYSDGRAIAANDFPAGGIVELTYDGAGHWQCLSVSPPMIIRLSPPRRLLAFHSVAGSYSFTFPTDNTNYFGICTGGGGSGAGSNYPTNSGGGGGAGGTAFGDFTATPGSTITLQVGAAGYGGSEAPFGTDGEHGGSSTLGAVMSGTGGGAGTCVANTAGGTGGVGIGGQQNDWGGGGNDGDFCTNGTAGNGPGGLGGASYWGGGTRANTTGGLAGFSAPGSGGGGAYGPVGAGASGADGRILIYG